eukprot:m.306302 g.306302  ORF g.306302 m.306302 type:complete len:62 (+) comp41135_c0_seq1:687-872(+)
MCLLHALATFSSLAEETRKLFPCQEAKDYASLLLRRGIVVWSRRLSNKRDFNFVPENQSIK